MNSFLTHFQKQAITNEISVGDHVIVSGKDEYKGWKGIVVQFKRISGEDIFTVELKANNLRIERLKQQLKKDFTK